MIDTVNPKSGLPLYRQIAEQITRAVAAGELRPGDRLPTVRDLAAQLLVNPNTVAKVYRDLERDGLLTTRRGAGTFVATSATSLAELERFRLISEQLERVARDVHTFGLAPERALELFRNLLIGRHPEGTDYE